MRRTIFLAFLFAFSAATSAADINGRYMTGGGAGAATCPEFTSAVERSKALTDGTRSGAVKSVAEVSNFWMYLLGYQTAYNQQTPDTFNIFGGLQQNQLFSWLENYCKTHPLEKFSDAVIQLSIELYPKRQKTESRP